MLAAILTRARDDCCDDGIGVEEGNSVLSSDVEAEEAVVGVRLPESDCCCSLAREREREGVVEECDDLRFRTVDQDERFDFESILIALTGELLV